MTSFENREEIKPLIKVIEFNFRVKVLQEWQVHCHAACFIPHWPKHEKIVHVLQFSPLKKFKTTL